MTHHSSCRENDKSLVWHCSTCGTSEDAEPLLDERDELAEKLQKSETENERLNKIIHGENMDPNGTIWECHAKEKARAERAEADLRKAKEKINDLKEAGEVLRGYTASYAMQTYDRQGTARKAINEWKEALAMDLKNPQPPSEGGR